MQFPVYEDNSFTTSFDRDFYERAVNLSKNKLILPCLGMVFEDCMFGGPFLCNHKFSIDISNKSFFEENCPKCNTSMYVYNGVVKSKRSSNSIYYCNEKQKFRRHLIRAIDISGVERQIDLDRVYKIFDIELRSRDEFIIVFGDIDFKRFIKYGLPDIYYGGKESYTYNRFRTGVFLINKNINTVKLFDCGCREIYETFKKEFFASLDYESFNHDYEIKSQSLIDSFNPNVGLELLEAYNVISKR